MRNIFQWPERESTQSMQSKEDSLESTETCPLCTRSSGWHCGWWPASCGEPRSLLICRRECRESWCMSLWWTMSKTSSETTSDDENLFLCLSCLHHQKWQISCSTVHAGFVLVIVKNVVVKFIYFRFIYVEVRR